jgi:hypothetical protein
VRQGVQRALKTFNNSLIQKDFWTRFRRCKMIGVPVPSGA